MIRGAIFDLDGTLLDTIGTITYFVNMTLSATDGNVEHHKGTESKWLCQLPTVWAHLAV